MRDKFIEKFRLPQEGYLQPIILQDTEIGFSVYKKRDTEGFKSLFRVFIRNEDWFNSDPLKAVIVTASYGKESDNGILISSSEFERGLSWPIEVTSEGDFFYNAKTNQLFYKKRVIEGIDLLKKVDEYHIKPTRFIKGFILRLKLRFFRKWASLIPTLFTGALYLVSGDRIIKNIWERKAEDRMSTKYETSHKLEEIESKKLNIFGYTASQWAVTFYSLVHLIIFAVAKIYNVKSSIISGIFSNNFLVVMYVIVTLGIVDALLPNILKYLIKKTTDFAIWSSYKNIKV